MAGTSSRVDVFRFDGFLIAEHVSPRPQTRPVRTGSESQRGRRSYAVRMSDSLLSPQEIRTADEGVRRAGPEYSDAVVAIVLERGDQDRGAWAARLASMDQPKPSAGLGQEAPGWAPVGADGSPGRGTDASRPAAQRLGRPTLGLLELGCGKISERVFTGSGNAHLSRID